MSTIHQWKQECRSSWCCWCQRDIFNSWGVLSPVCLPHNSHKNITWQRKREEVIVDGRGQGFAREGSMIGYVCQKGKDRRSCFEAIEHFNTTFFNYHTCMRHANLIMCLFYEILWLITRQIDCNLWQTKQKYKWDNPKRKHCSHKPGSFLYILQGGNEGGTGYDPLSFKFDMSTETVASYICDIVKRCVKASKMTSC